MARVSPDFLTTVVCITDAITGGGLIIMLSGKPGVGKTLSAESCAERLQLPLYKMELREDDGYISPSDCDTNQAPYNATNTRASIEKQFELVTKWNAVLLVDECDAFLQKRSREDPERSGVMSSMTYFFLRNPAKGVELIFSQYSSKSWSTTSP
jgi:SpoVK/Ycf46/Vps4 family AAA+-type ATPase